MLYFIKYEKMNYIRDYCKFIAFDVFKTRTNFMNNDFYIIFEKMIKEFYNMFDDFDKLIKCDAELHNLAIIIKFIKNKTFDEFYARFLIIITLLNYSESYKIFILKRFIIFKLRF